VSTGGADFTADWTRRDFDQFARRVGGGGADGLMRAATHLRGEANKTIPIEEGTLQRSGGVDVDAQAGEASVYYDTPYAVAQHENSAHRHAPGRRAKWLELSAGEQARQIAELIGGGLRKVLG
jgi:hypothetical protein